jgi:hypothetical protein
MCQSALKGPGTQFEQSADDPLKTGFSRQGRKQGELVEFVYKSFDLTFEELTAKVYQ